LVEKKGQHPEGMSAKTPARSLSNRRGLASRWDACFFMMSSGGVASLNHRLVRFDASGISLPIAVFGLNYPGI
jgi:hypothetical protein